MQRGRQSKLSPSYPAHNCPSLRLNRSLRIVHKVVGKTAVEVVSLSVISTSHITHKHRDPSTRLHCSWSQLQFKTHLLFSHNNICWRYLLIPGQRRKSGAQCPENGVETRLLSFLLEFCLVSHNRRIVFFDRVLMLLNHGADHVEPCSERSVPGCGTNATNQRRFQSDTRVHWMTFLWRNITTSLVKNHFPTFYSIINFFSLFIIYY